MSRYTHDATRARGLHVVVERSRMTHGGGVQNMYTDDNTCNHHTQAVAAPSQQAAQPRTEGGTEVEKRASAGGATACRGTRNASLGSLRRGHAGGAGTRRPPSVPSSENAPTAIIDALAIAASPVNVLAPHL